jgi:hypothetical protein
MDNANIYDIERMLDELAVLYAQTHDEKVRNELVQLVKQLPNLPQDNGKQPK